MLNRNKIFKTVRDTTNSLNVSTGKKMDNFYTELMIYEDMVQKRYDKIKDILNTIKYHHNKILNLDKNYTNAIFGGGKTDLAKLMKDIDSAIDSIDILFDKKGILNTFGTLIDKKNKELLTEITDLTDNSKIQKKQVTENNKVFFQTANDELTEIKKEFDENKRYINSLIETIKKIEDPVNQYILDKKLSKDFRQGIKEGIRSLSKLIDDASKDDLQKFNTYKNNITSGLAYAKAEEDLAKKLEKDPNASDDLKILQQFKKDKNSLQFIFNSGTTGYLKGSGSNQIQFDYSYDHNKKHKYHKLNFKSTDYIKIIFVRIQSSKNNYSPSREYFLELNTINTINDQKELRSNVSSIYTKLQGYAKKAKDDTEAKKDRKEDEDSAFNPMQILKYLADNKIFSEDLLNHLESSLESKTIKDAIIDGKETITQEITASIKTDLAIFEKKIEGGGGGGGGEEETRRRRGGGGGEREEEEARLRAVQQAEEKRQREEAERQEAADMEFARHAKAEKESLTKNVNKTNEILKKIRKQIEEDYDKEHSSANKPQDPKPKQNDIVKSAKTMFGVNTQEEDEDNKITNSIISSIIENYEKERSSVNTIEDKIKLDTKFVDILDNLGLNLSDIFKINFEDKLAFIFFILILHIVVYSIVESLIMNDYLTDIVYIMAVYVGVYFLIMFILILILNKYVNYRMKSILNYLNTDFNMQLITMHLFIVFMFYIIVLILSQHIDIFVAKEVDDKLQILYRIEVISSIIFIFSSIFVMLL